MRFVPNLLSLSRLPIAGLVLWLSWTEHWKLATLLLLIGLLTDALDGALARRFNVASSLGGDLLEPVCDFALGAAALLGLVLSGNWNWWVTALCVGIPLAILQAISELDRHAQSKPGYNGSLIKRFKRHQYYIHPYFAVAVITVASAWYVALATNSGWIVSVYIGLVAGVCSLKRKRVLALANGPQA